MASPLLNTNSIIMCPHGGIASHTPTSGTSYRVDGRVPMLETDLYTVSGCPYGHRQSGPCFRIQWVTASNMLIIKGRRALTYESVGICQSASGIAYGPAVVTYTQTGQLEPATLTRIVD